MHTPEQEFKKCPVSGSYKRKRKAEELTKNYLRLFGCQWKGGRKKWEGKHGVPNSLRESSHCPFYFPFISFKKTKQTKLINFPQHFSLSYPLPLSLFSLFHHVTTEVSKANLIFIPQKHHWKSLEWKHQKFHHQGQKPLQDLPYRSNHRKVQQQ